MVSTTNGQQDQAAVSGRSEGLRSLAWGAVVFWLAACTVVLVVSGIAFGRDTRLAPFLVVLPALIAGRGTVRQTSVASVWVTLIIIGSLIDRPLETAGANLVVVVFAMVFSGLSVARAEQRVRHEGEIARLRSAAAALQRQILRPFPLVTDELIVHGLYEPVEEDSRVGGDIYEVVASPYGSRVFIADVQGKGLPAIGAAFAALSTFREAAMAEPTLTAVVDLLEEAVLRHNSFAEHVGERERFVTGVVLSVGSELEVQAINCGHVPPLLLHGEHAGPALRDEPSVPLGLDSLAPGPRTVEWFAFPADSALLLCTDGVTEARDPAGRFYPLEERAAALGSVPVGEVAPTLYRQLQQHTAGARSDDTAVLVLRRRSTAGGH
ncbi:PP2C family protein-serine/threonine phosphatase [Streptomyces sp. HUAS ZL42]|uniref:PP2C family protein-serine/threonine phosphatase n=1 Tax=Streptomyces sp. HUAS ZL42 TaxID=3231715 RepID=UPI00345EF439